jgi:hypothetical protein
MYGSGNGMPESSIKSYPVHPLKVVHPRPVKMPGKNFNPHYYQDLQEVGTTKNYKEF